MSQTAAIITITVCQPDHKAEIKTISLSQYELESIRKDNGLTLVEWARLMVNRGITTALDNQRDTPEHIRECSADRYYNS